MPMIPKLLPLLLGLHILMIAHVVTTAVDSSLGDESHCALHAESLSHGAVLLQSDSRRAGSWRLQDLLSSALVETGITGLEQGDSDTLKESTVTRGSEASPASSSADGELRPASEVSFHVDGDVSSAVTAIAREQQQLSSTASCTAKDGSACVFGLDVRDENTHCIPDFEYGSFGWCYTKADMSTWGSCQSTCPLFGPERVLDRKLEAAEEKLHELVREVDDMTEHCCGDKKKPKESAKSAPKSGGKTPPQSSLSQRKTSRSARVPAKDSSRSLEDTPSAKALLTLLKRGASEE